MRFLFFFFFFFSRHVPSHEPASSCGFSPDGSTDNSGVPPQHFVATNQNLLRALNVTHDRLDDICMIAQKHGMCGKYTDIGHGRYAYVWCPRHVDEPCDHVVPLVNELRAHGYDITETRLARDGVRIEPLAV